MRVQPHTVPTNASSIASLCNENIHNGRIEQYQSHIEYNILQQIRDFY